MLMRCGPVWKIKKEEPQNVLNECLEIREEYNRTLARLRSLRTMMELHPVTDEEIIGREEYVETEMVARCLELEEMLEEAEKMMKALPKALRVILHDRYVAGLPWNEVAEKNNYSLDYCYVLHRKAIRHLEDVLN